MSASACLTVFGDAKADASSPTKPDGGALPPDLPNSELATADDTIKRLACSIYSVILTVAIIVCCSIDIATDIRSSQIVTLPIVTKQLLEFLFLSISNVSF